MDPLDRKNLGKSGMLPSEAAQKQNYREENRMHEQYSGWLRRNGLLYLHASPNKRSTLPVGWPDFTVFGAGAKTLFVEFKTKRGKLSDDQKAVMADLTRFGHVAGVLGCYETAVEFTKQEFGL